MGEATMLVENVGINSPAFGFSLDLPLDVVVEVEDWSASDASLLSFSLDDIAFGCCSSDVVAEVAGVVVVVVLAALEVGIIGAA